jgi:hypothetical protein
MYRVSWYYHPRLQGVLILSPQATGCPDIITPGYRVSSYYHPRLQGVLLSSHQATGVLILWPQAIGCPDIITPGYRVFWYSIITPGYRVSWYHHTRLLGVLISSWQATECSAIISLGYWVSWHNLSRIQVSYHSLTGLQVALTLYLLATGCPDIISGYSWLLKRATIYHSSRLQNILPQQAVWCPDIITTATRVSRH